MCTHVGMHSVFGEGGAQWRGQHCMATDGLGLKLIDYDLANIKDFHVSMGITGHSHLSFQLFIKHFL
jgi:hypothetical protein